MLKLRKEKMEKIKNVLLQLLLMPIEWLVESSDKGCKVRKPINCNYSARYSHLSVRPVVRLNSCTPRQLSLPVRKIESSAGFSSFYFSTLLMTLM